MPVLSPGNNSCSENELSYAIIIIIIINAHGGEVPSYPYT